MASFLNFSPHLVLSTVSDPSRNPTPLFPRTRCPQYIFTHHKPFNRGAHPVAMVGFNHDMFTDPESAGALLGELRGRAEAVLFTIADAAASSTDSVVDTKSSSDWLSGITVSMENVLKVLKDGLTWLHVPYSYGFAIILLTVIVKAATFPLTKKQVESAMAMRSLQPQIKAVQQCYAGDQERIQLETARLYKLAGINPLAGCLPTLLTIPIWIGLYRALSNVANEGLLTEGFFWIPSLSGPTTISASGGGLSWLFPFLDGHPPLGWSDTFAYLVLPLLLIVSQYTSVQIMQSSQANDPNMRNSQVITNFLPLLIGYFALSVPSGLSLYWFTNNILTTVQQVWLQKLGGAKIPARDLSDYISRNDPTQIQKPVLEINSAEMSGEQGEKLTSVGLRPGERFKKLKEEEARTKRQRELAAASNTRAMSEGPGNSPDNGLNERLESVAAMTESSNGGLARPGVEEQETPSFDRLKNGRIPASSGVDGQDILQFQQVVIEKRQDSG